MERITCKKNDGIAVVSIDRPEALNALNREIVDELEAVIDEIGADESIMALIIGGTENFAAGADIKGMVECNPQQARAFAFNQCYNK